MLEKEVEDDEAGTATKKLWLYVLREAITTEGFGAQCVYVESAGCLLSSV